MARTKGGTSKKRTSEQREPTPDVADSNVEETEEEVRRDLGEKPVWTKKQRLEEMGPDWQTQLYNDKLKEVPHKSDLILAERKVTLEVFQNYGLVECFERLGWKQTLLFNNSDKKEIYLNEILEWMSTLTNEPGTNPPRTMKLVGFVNGKKVILSFGALSKIAYFDTNESGSGPYEYLSPEEIFCKGKKQKSGAQWLEMLKELFAKENISEKMKLNLNDLKPLPRLIMKLLTWNVVPRKGDKMLVRSTEVRVLYALMTGRPKLSFKHLVLFNIWEAHEEKERTSIPHCRLLSKLLGNAKAISPSAKPIKFPQVPFHAEAIGKYGFELRVTREAYVLVDKRNKRSQAFERIGPLEDDGNANGDGDGDNVNVEVETAHEEEGFEMMRTNWNYTDLPSTFGSWSPSKKAIWERETRRYEEEKKQKEATEKWRRDQEEIIKYMVYQQERYYHNLFQYFEQVRHHENYKAGVPYQETYTPTEFRTRPIDAVLPLPGYPQLQPPDWWPKSSGSGEGSSSSQPQNPFDTSSSGSSLWESIFGKQHDSH